MRRFESTLLLLLFGLLAATAQNRTVTGTVLDQTDNLPVIGATVSVMTPQGTVATGTTTDLDGKFRLEIPAKERSLTVRFMGYTTATIALKNGQTDYTVRLESSSKEMSELVVTGYQEIDRRKLTSAITTVKMSDEIIGGINSIDQALAGQIAGLSSVASSGSPGAPVKLRIRGISSISGSQDPLWVLDGIPLEGTDIPSMKELQDIDNIYQTSIAGINPQDIESITVLKDAAATAIYGARAANGVIVITTKRGKVGKPQINFSMKLTYNPKTDIDRLNLLTSDEKVDLELALLQSDYTYRENKGDVARIIAGYGLTDAYKSGGWAVLSPEAQADINALRSINTDWNDILFRDVFNQEYNVSLSGGSEKATYYSALGYYVEQGNVESVKNDRFNLTLKTNYRINSKLKVGASVFANRRKQRSYLTFNEGFTNPVYYSRIANPYLRPFDDEGNYDGTGYLAGAKDGETLYTPIDMDSLFHTIDSLGCPAVIIIDACYSGNTADNETPVTGWDGLLDGLDLMQTSVLTASQPTELSYVSSTQTEEGETERHSLFTIGVLQALGWRHSSFRGSYIYIGGQAIWVRGYLAYVPQTMTTEDLENIVMGSWMNSQQTPYFNSTGMKIRIVP